MRSKFSSLDLNLLAVFAALHEDRNVTRVAARLNSTQSTISQALARLRSALGDDLFVRAPDGMVPTPYAEHLAQPVRDALKAIEAAVEGGRAFDPLHSRRLFALAINNQTAVALAPRLARAAAAAPGVTLDMRPSGTLDIAEHIDVGVIDIAIGGYAAMGERFLDQYLYDDDYVVVFRAGHRASQPPGMTLELFSASAHLVLSSTGDDTSFIEEELARSGGRRHIALCAPLLAAGDILGNSDMITVVARRTAEVIARNLPLCTAALPVASPTLTSRMLWHRRFDSDPGHRWLRSLVAAAGQEARTPASASARATDAR